MSLDKEGVFASPPSPDQGDARDNAVLADAEEVSRSEGIRSREHSFGIVARSHVPPWRAHHERDENRDGSRGMHCRVANHQSRRRGRGGLPGWTGGMGLLVWQAPSGAKDREWRTLLAIAIDGRASLPSPGTPIKVTNLQTGQHVVVKINDRGPYGSGDRRIIDLSEAAAKRVGLLARGTARVQVMVVENAS